MKMSEVAMSHLYIYIRRSDGFSRYFVEEHLFFSVSFVSTFVFCFFPGYLKSFPDPIYRVTRFVICRTSDFGFRVPIDLRIGWADFGLSSGCLVV